MNSCKQQEIIPILLDGKTNKTSTIEDHTKTGLISQTILAAQKKWDDMRMENWDSKDQK
jgi:hypothetical protein